jgi:hypothetical protein
MNGGNARFGASVELDTIALHSYNCRSGGALCPFFSRNWHQLC